jgi:peptidoglycan hydrolase-like protein with peptidoglycan-binding domain
MARYSYGSSGDGVKELQEMLNATGKYNLDTDGIYGNQTQQAVRDYQSKNNLTVDGVAGDQTLGHLRGNSSSMETEQEAPVVQPYQPTYTESQTVKDSQTQLDTHKAQQPGAYQSGYSEKLNALYDKIMNREPHQYDMNKDIVYQQLKDRYIQQGLMAAEDTIGQAASLTGGFGNTYAQKVGQQAYQKHLQGLNDKIPELVQMDLNRYQMEGDRLADQYAMMMQQENQDYARHQDAQNAWLAERDYLAGRYDSERGYDYSKWQDQRDFGVQQQNTKYDRLVSLITNTGYNPTAQELADAGMNAAEAAAYQQVYNEQNTPSYSGNGYYPYIDESDEDPLNPKYTADYETVKAHVYGDARGDKSDMKADILRYLNDGAIDRDTALQLIVDLGLEEVN